VVDLSRGEPQDTVQVPAGQNATIIAPRLVKFSGVVKDTAGQPRTGVVGATFAIYKEQEGGAPLWMETQNIQLDASGHFNALLGATKAEGLPLELFAASESRWLGMQVQLPGEIEQSRVLLVSVPYALKAVDADSLGGKPASAYALAGGAPANAAGPGTTPASKTANTATILAGTSGFIPVFTDNAGSLGNSVVVQSGGSIGIGTIPVVRFDVNGGIRGDGIATGGRSVAPDAINTNAVFLNGSNAIGVLGASNLAIGPGALYTKTSIFAGGTERITLDSTNDNVSIGSRRIQVGQPKAMTLAMPGFTSLMSIALTGTQVAGGRIFYTIRATDGGSQIAVEEGVIQYAATANSITCTVQTSDKLHLGTVGSGCTPGFFNPGSQPGISIFDNVVFSSPAPVAVNEVTFTIENQSTAAIRLEP
jgi:hypothetical protein